MQTQKYSHAIPPVHRRHPALLRHECFENDRRQPWMVSKTAPMQSGVGFSRTTYYWPAINPTLLWVALAAPVLQMKSVARSLPWKHLPSPPELRCRPLSRELKSLGDILHDRLRFDSHARAVAQACSFEALALRHILPSELAKTIVV